MQSETFIIHSLDCLHVPANTDRMHTICHKWGVDFFYWRQTRIRKQYKRQKKCTRCMKTERTLIMRQMFRNNRDNEYINTTRVHYMYTVHDFREFDWLHIFSFSFCYVQKQTYVPVEKYKIKIKKCGRTKKKNNKRFESLIWYSTVIPSGQISSNRWAVLIPTKKFRELHGCPAFAALSNYSIT